MQAAEHRRQLTTNDCDHQLQVIAERLQGNPDDDRERLMLDADRWLDQRNHLTKTEAA